MTREPAIYRELHWLKRLQKGLFGPLGVTLILWGATGSAPLAAQVQALPGQQPLATGRPAPVKAPEKAEAAPRTGAPAAGNYPVPQPGEPPEEDEGQAPRQYAFNPLQAQKEMSTGDFYKKRGNYRAAANRYIEATRWDDGSAEAFFKLGEAQEKLREYGEAREAFTKFLGLTSDQKEADKVKKRMAKFPAAKSAK